MKRRAIFLKRVLKSLEHLAFQNTLQRQAIVPAYGARFIQGFAPYALAVGVLLLPSATAAGEALAAVATNFLRTAEKIAADFEADTGHKVTFSSGATGTLYAQIVRGAPYDLFLAADAERPARLLEEGKADADSLITYAVGALVLYSADPDRVSGPGSISQNPPRRFAMANPRTAPYGRAAEEVIAALGWSDVLQSKIVRGENVGQAFAMIASGNAEVGLVARSALSRSQAGSHWAVPTRYHAPIRQDAVLTPRGANNEAARAFHAYLVSAPARERLSEDGYVTGDVE